MTAMEPLCQILGINSNKFTKKENLILEAKLFTHVYEELKELIKTQYKDYFQLMKFNEDMENRMIEIEFIRCVIKDILSTEEYSLSGIAHYTNTPEDVVHEIIAGHHREPSFSFSRRVIELHRTVRPDVYQAIMNKITNNSSH
jgi:hypothetical protein